MASAGNNDEVQVYEDLQGFLLSERVDVRQAATEAVLQIQNQEAHRLQILQHNNGQLLQALIRNASYESDNTNNEASLQIPVNALHALVYLSSHGSTANQYAEVLLEAHNMIARLLEIVLSSPSSSSAKEEAWRKKINYAVALLANLTRLERGAVEMVGRTLPDEAVKVDDAPELQLKVKPTMELLLDRYLNQTFVEAEEKWVSTDDDNMEPLTVAQVESQGHDPYQHFAAVLMNTTQVEQGRKFLLQLHYTTKEEDGTTYFQRLLPQLKSANPVRRQGTAGTVRNVCLDKDSAWWLLNTVQVSTDLLYPLTGPEELEVEEKQGLHPDLWLQGPDKQREPDVATRGYLVEAVLLLCASGRPSRERLRLDRAYVILKWADMVEESEHVSACIGECVQYLRRDEAGTEEGSSDAFVANAYKKPAASLQIRAGDNEAEDDGNYDSVD